MSLSLCHNTWAAELIKKEVQIPVIASGSITLPEYAEDIIATGKADFVGLGRPLLADPEWSKKAAEDRPEDIRPCIRCNEGCLERTFFRFQAITCAVNPVISREGDLQITPASAKKKIAVVGCGPAGLEAARVAKIRGHDVTLFERNRLGGSLNEAAKPEFKADIRALIRNMIHQVQKLQIPVIQKEVAFSDLHGRFDAIVTACGAESIALPIPGAEKPHVLKVMDVINDQTRLKGKIAMIGGGLVGAETALDLAENGHDVTIIEMLDSIMTGVAVTDLLAYNERFAKTSVVTHVKTRLLEIRDNAIIVETSKGKLEIPADTVVMSVGFRPRNVLYNALHKAGNLVCNVGDSVRPNKIMDAIHTGYKAGLNL
jgi:NADPH-dependent 2,4-dienoyl-CoA reductase/sulfur reductase-like enzyme